MAGRLQLGNTATLLPHTLDGHASLAMTAKALPSWSGTVPDNSPMKTIRLKDGKERSLLRRHPWVFDSAIAKGGGDPGETVRVESHAGQFLGWASFSPSSRIRARVWSFDEAQRIDAAFIEARIAQAVAARQWFDIQSDGVRLVHGESDGLPGLIVDRYADTLVAQFTSCGTERWKDVLADALLELTGLSRLYERSDANVRALEGLPELRGCGCKQVSVETAQSNLDCSVLAQLDDKHAAHGGQIDSVFEHRKENSRIRRPARHSVVAEDPRFYQGLRCEACAQRAAPLRRGGWTAPAASRPAAR